MIPKYLRKENKAEFLILTQKLAVETFRMSKNMSSTGRNHIGEKMINNSLTIYDNIFDANSIYMYKDITENDFNERARMYSNALVKLSVMLKYYSLIRLLMNENLSLFPDKSKEKQDNILQRNLEITVELRKQINKIIKSDKKRYKEFQKEKNREGFKVKQGKDKENSVLRNKIEQANRTIDILSGLCDMKEEDVDSLKEFIKNNRFGSEDLSEKIKELGKSNNE